MDGPPGKGLRSRVGEPREAADAGAEELPSYGMEQPRERAWCVEEMQEMQKDSLGRAYNMQDLPRQSGYASGKRKDSGRVSKE